MSVALDFAAQDLRRFARAKQQLQRQRALRPLKRILKEIISKPTSESSANPRFSNYDGGSSQRVGFRQTPGPLGYLAHLLRLMSYLVSFQKKDIILNSAILEDSYFLSYVYLSLTTISQQF